MFDTILWIAVLVVMLIVEASTVSLVSIWFAGGALCAMIVSFLGDHILLQLCLFLGVSCLLLAMLWPVRSKLLRRRIQPTNADRVIGMTALVTEDVDNIQGAGAVQVDGKVWTARSSDGKPLSAGELVRVERIEGVKLYVSRIPAEVQS